MTAHEIHGLSGAYAVDALDPEERARFEAHLSACADCRAEVASLQEAASLFTEVSATDPSAALRARVLDDISKVRPLPPVVDLATRRRPRWVNALAAAAAAAVFFGGGAAVWQSTHDTTPLNPADSVIQALDADHVTVNLGNGTSATVYRSFTENRAAIVTRRMPAPPKGRDYQLWLLKGGRMVSAGVMKETANQAVLLQGDLDDASAVGITVEPDGGSKEPTTDPVALFDFERAT